MTVNALAGAVTARRDARPYLARMTWPLLLTALAAAPPQHAFSVNGALSLTDSHGTVGYQLRTEGGWQLGAQVRVAAPRSGFINGYPTTGGVAPSAAINALAPLTEVGPLQLSLALQLGLLGLFADTSVGPDTRSLVLLSRLGPLASIRLADAVALRAGWNLVVNVQLSPAGDVDALGQLLVLGAVVHLNRSLSVWVDVETGGLFGYSGDGGKYVLRGTLGLRLVLGEGAPWNTF